MSGTIRLIVPPARAPLGRRYIMEPRKYMQADGCVERAFLRQGQCTRIVNSAMRSTGTEVEKTRAQVVYDGKRSLNIAVVSFPVECCFRTGHRPHEITDIDFDENTKLQSWGFRICVEGNTVQTSQLSQALVNSDSCEIARLAKKPSPPVCISKCTASSLQLFHIRLLAFFVSSCWGCQGSWQQKLCWAGITPVGAEVWARPSSAFHIDDQGLQNFEGCALRERECERVTHTAQGDGVIWTVTGRMPMNVKPEPLPQAQAQSCTRWCLTIKDKLSIPKLILVEVLIKGTSPTKPGSDSIYTHEKVGDTDQLLDLRRTNDGRRKALGYSTGESPFQFTSSIAAERRIMIRRDV
ncbi:hypothetical protein BC826DRAFT_1175512 [Russula brevipes]|nr:hypothetical protein BC826DRAFT_1175512 [Russula brevipes]